MKTKAILKKIILLNQTAIHVMAEENNLLIIKNFTERSIEIFEADFGFAWGKFNGDDVNKLAYKSPSTPYNPTIPREKRNNHAASKRKNSFFDSNVKKGNYKPDISSHLKSYIIIPVHYVDHVYGSIILCYKKQRIFTKEELALVATMGNIIAQGITINWLVDREKKNMALAEKQKEIEVLFDQEKLKTEFTANATHEIRTPLAIMKGNIDLALMGKGDPKSARDALKAVSIEINILSEILKGLALLTSSNRDVKQIINPISVDITAVISKIIKRLKTMAAAKNISIQIKTEKKHDLTLLGDEKYLERLFLNIIKNAITYGKKNGNISVDAHRNRNMAIVKITDNGIGISKEDLPKIFERFYRADKAHSSYGNHSGLGLAIAKWIAEMHLGAINAESTLGKGSTFTVTLPLSDDKVGH